MMRVRLGVIDLISRESESRTHLLQRGHFQIELRVTPRPLSSSGMPPSVDTMKKAQLIEALLEFGERPPARWTLLELRQRLAELRPEEGNNKKSERTIIDEDNAQTLKDWVKVVKQRKAWLIELCQGRMGMRLSGHETIPVLEKRAMTWIIENTEAEPDDFVGFGKYSAVTYETAAMDSGYRTWVMKTAAEEAGADPRLKRLARWMATQPAAPKPKTVETKPKGKSKGYPTGASASNEPPEPQNTASSQAIHDLTQLVRQLQADVSSLKEEKQERPRKGPHRADAPMTSSDETDSSYQVVKK